MNLGQEVRKMQACILSYINIALFFQVGYAGEILNPFKKHSARSVNLLSELTQLINTKNQ
jgi:hypothetical protein